MRSPGGGRHVMTESLRAFGETNRKGPERSKPARKTACAARGQDDAAEQTHRKDSDERSRRGKPRRRIGCDPVHRRGEHGQQPDAKETVENDRRGNGPIAMILAQVVHLRHVAADG